MLLILNALVKIVFNAPDQLKIYVSNAVALVISLMVYASRNVKEDIMKIKNYWYAIVAIQNVKLALALKKMNASLVKRLLSMVILGYLIFSTIKENHATKLALSILTKY